MKLKQHPSLLPAIVCTLVLVFAVLGASPLFADDDDDDKEAEEEVAETEEGVMPATDVEAVKAKVKEVVMVKGTLASIKEFEGSGNLLVKFADSELAIFVRKTDLDKDLPWDLESWIDEEVYVAGPVKIYREQVELLVSNPNQIAESAEDIDLASIKKSASAPTKKPATKKPAKIAGAITPTKKDYSDVPLKLESATVQTVAFHLEDTNLRVRDDPYGLPEDRMAPALAPVTATAKTVENSGPMQIVFVKPEKGSKSHIAAAIDQLAESYGKWPKDKVVTIDVDFDSRAFKDDPASLVIVALIHSMVTGKEIPSNVVISADVDSDGTIVAPRGNETEPAPNYRIVDTVGENAAEPVRLVCADMDPTELNDLAIDGKWPSLAKVSAISVSTLKEALQVIFADPAGELGTAFAAFDQAQAVIAKDGAKMVRNSHVQARVLTAGKAWPNHKSAVFYAFSARGKMPRTYSLSYTHHVLNDFHSRVRYQHALMPEEGAKEQFRKLTDELKDMKQKFDPDLSKLLRALNDFAGEAEDAVLKPREGRALERQTEKLTDADTAVVEGLAAIQSQIENGGEAEE